MSSRENVRDSILRDECVVQQDAIFICFWHHKSEAVQWLESGKAGLAQMAEQRKVFSDQGLEVHESIWDTTELAGVPYIIEFCSFGPTGDAAVETPDIVALALADRTIHRRYVYAVCRNLGKLPAEERQLLLSKASQRSSGRAEAACAQCGQRRLPTVQILEPGEGFPDSSTVMIHNAKLLLSASNGAVVSAKFQRLPDVPDATGTYDIDEKGATRKFGTGGGTGARLKVKDLLPLSLCSRCKAVLYCSPECQKIDWRTHKASCTASKQ
mmetsp:Transcript_1266/g.2638  ORF Transcript_1266/g.2638 Transcript_1266/m.2638 type:complete len:269 (+) Transcript_1266:62-868(+)